MNMYSKKPASTVTSTEEAAPIDISSDEDDETSPTPSSITADTGKTAPPKVPVTVPANGTKQVDKESFDSLLQSKRPGPASQKKRRLDEIETPPPVTTPSTSSAASKPKKFKKEVYAKKSSVTFADIGGLDKTLKEICELILHVKHPEIYKHIGLPPPRGFLLHGAPGCGKTLLAHAIAGQLEVLLIEVPATELVAGVSGESEERIREIFEQAASFAPCVLFIDEIDAVSSNRQTAQKDMERRIVSQLIASLDNLSKMRFGDQVLVIGATNRPDALDPALRRVGRFDHEISLGIPDRNARTQILQIISRNLKLEQPFDFDEIASLTPGYVGADLLALATRAASTAIKRVITENEKEKVIEHVENEKATEIEITAEIAAAVNIEEDALIMEVDSNEIKASNEEESKIENPETNPTEELTILPTMTEPATVADLAKDSEMETDEQQKPEENIIEVIKENIIEEIKKQPQLKVALTLDDMIKWLENDVQPMSDSELKTLSIQRDDFIEALKHLQPSAKREGFITVPDVTWDDIGSLQDIRDELKLAILAPVKFPEKLIQLGLTSPSGVLLCGPPGCGKTLLAKAVANEAGINFISVKGPELLNMVKKKY